jgi:hypothetical protein
LAGSKLAVEKVAFANLKRAETVAIKSSGLKSDGEDLFLIKVFIVPKGEI